MILVVSVFPFQKTFCHFLPAAIEVSQVDRPCLGSASREEGLDGLRSFYTAHCKCLLAWPRGKKHDEKLPGGGRERGKYSCGVGEVHRAVSQPASHLQDQAPEKGWGCPGGGHSWVPAGAAAVVSLQGRYGVYVAPSLWEGR